MSAACAQPDPRDEPLPPAAAAAGAPDPAQAQLQQMVDAIAHDLRAPLRSIEGFAQLLDQHAATTLDATGHDYLARIRAAARQMDTLLAGLAELSWVTRTPLQAGEVDLSLLAEWVLADLCDAEPQRVVSISVQPDLHGRGDERLLRIALAQLLRNAWAFTRDTDAARIEVSGETDASGTRLRVHDNGRGFDMRYVCKLFQPFQRLHAPEQGAGPGLGLAIAQRVLARHGGGLRAESDPAAGTTFHLDLPAPGAGVA